MSKYPIYADRIAKSHKTATGFIIATILLCGLGLTALYSGSTGYALRMFGDPLYFIKRQFLFLAFSIICMTIIIFIDLDITRTFLPLIMLGTLILCILPFVPVIGVEKNGAYRWIAIGSATFQPSELVKISIVLFLANLFTKKHDRLDEAKVSVIPAIIMLLIFVAVIYLQNDFSTAIFVLLIGLSMFFVSGVRLRWFIGMVLVTIPVALFFIFTKSFRVRRIISFLYPELDPAGASYQSIAAVEAVSSGGFWGRGIGGGVRKVSSIPEVQADFIFAAWAEEMGFFGIIVYFALLVWFSYAGYSIAVQCKDRFRSLVCFGSVNVILFQSLMNCGVVSQFFPATGIPLPFFSAGGSSLLITMCLCGIIINISRWESNSDISKENDENSIRSI